MVLTVVVLARISFVFGMPARCDGGVGGSPARLRVDEGVPCVEDRDWRFLMEILQIAQHAANLNRAAEFYETLLGGPPAARFDPPGLLFFNVGRSRLLLEAAATSALIYFQVDDVRARIEELRAQGIEIVDEPRVIFSHTDDSLGPTGTDEWMAFIRDSEGNTVGLVSHEPRHDP
jgi:methylmalonyl-CoA/ethylmalonyl-CoA epimerase